MGTEGRGPALGTVVGAFPAVRKATRCFAPNAVPSPTSCPPTDTRNVPVVVGFV
jgi:hypothetical protein